MVEACRRAALIAEAKIQSHDVAIRILRHAAGVTTCRTHALDTARKAID